MHNIDETHARHLVDKISYPRGWWCDRLWRPIQKKSKETITKTSTAWTLCLCFFCMYEVEQHANLFWWFFFLLRLLSNFHKIYNKALDELERYWNRLEYCKSASYTDIIVYRTLFIFFMYTNRIALSTWNLYFATYVVNAISIRVLVSFFCSFYRCQTVLQIFSSIHSILYGASVVQLLFK